MRDEDFEIFIEEFGEASSRIAVPAESIDLWRGKLPDALLDYWSNEGWCSYSNGLFWTVDPTYYERTLAEWLRSTPLDKIDKFHVIARTAFGKLYLWGERTGDSVSIVPHANAIFCLPSDLQRVRIDYSFELRCFFSNRDRNSVDLSDSRKKPMFEAALQELGELKSHEMYGFKHALVLGGKPELENLEKVDILEHLGFLRQLDKPTLPMSGLDLDRLS